MTRTMLQSQFSRTENSQTGPRGATTCRFHKVRPLSLARSLRAEAYVTCGELTDYVVEVAHVWLWWEERLQVWMHRWFKRARVSPTNLYTAPDGSSIFCRPESFTLYGSRTPQNTTLILTVGTYPRSCLHCLYWQAAHLTYKCVAVRSNARRAFHKHRKLCHAVAPHGVLLAYLKCFYYSHRKKLCSLHLISASRYRFPCKGTGRRLSSFPREMLSGLYERPIAAGSRGRSQQ